MMGSECLALQWGFVGRLLPRKMACAPALEFGFQSSMAVAERRRRGIRPVAAATIVLARLTVLASVLQDASCLAPCFLALCSICGAPLIVVVAERHTFKTIKPQRYRFSCTETQARISGRLVLSVVHRSRRRAPLASSLQKEFDLSRGEGCRNAKRPMKHALAAN